MAPTHAELVRRVYEAIDRGDTRTVLDAYDPQVELDFSRSPFREVLDHSVYCGIDGIRSFIRERFESWEVAEDELMEVIDRGDRVITVVISKGRGRASGVHVERMHFGVWTMSEGRIVRIDWFGTRDEALAAAPAAG